MCEDWSAVGVFAMDMGMDWRPGLTLERINNSGNYEPDNCRWASRLDQSRNCRRNRWIEHDGKKMILEDWARELGISRRTIYSRLIRHKWSVERALTTRPRGMAHHV